MKGVTLSSFSKTSLSPHSIRSPYAIPELELTVSNFTYIVGFLFFFFFSDSGIVICDHTLSKSSGLLAPQDSSSEGKDITP